MLDPRKRSLTGCIMIYIDVCHYSIDPMKKNCQASTTAEAKDSELEKLVIDKPSCRTPIDEVSSKYQFGKFVWIVFLSTRTVFHALYESMWIYFILQKA